MADLTLPDASGLSCGLLSTFYSLLLGPQMPFAFEKLHVCQKGVDFADAIASFTESLPRGYGFLTDQLNRASLSIAANLAEGNGRSTKADRRNSLTRRIVNRRNSLSLPDSWHHG